MFELKPYRVEISDSDLTSLKSKLELTRLPESETVDDWTQGIPLGYMSEVKSYWQNEYDWRRCEATINQYDQFTTEVFGLDIHFMHIKSEASDAQAARTYSWLARINRGVP